MQTFLPYPSFEESAKVLDYKRLGKQRVETLQVLQVLLGERLVTSDIVVTKGGASKSIPRPKAQWEREKVTAKGWRRHPAVLMWQGYEFSLFLYQKAMCEEWVSRGYEDSCLEKSEILIEPHMDRLSRESPKFLGSEVLHLSHKSNLLRKDEAFYKELWGSIPNDLPYDWPKSLNQVLASRLAAKSPGE